MNNNIRINKDRLWSRIMAMAEIGATDLGGSCRLALTEEDRKGRDLFIQWCRDAGCQVAVDEMGNIFATRQGISHERLPIASGSHLDTQPHGGKFDGVYGVLAALEVIETLNDHAVETQSPLVVTVWTNEEGARFAPPMVASGVYAGIYDLEYGLSRKDFQGVTLRQALRSIDYLGDFPCGHNQFAAFLEAHIEQGPVLEKNCKTIGVVTGVQGTRWYKAWLYGQDAHTGSTPMLGRRDALIAAARVIVAVQDIAQRHTPDAVATVGYIDNNPNSHNTIPGKVELAIDVRHPDLRIQEVMEEELRTAIAQISDREHVDYELVRTVETPPVKFDDSCIKAVEYAARELGHEFQSITSGAGHDACHISKAIPTSMIFVPCEKGLSHNERENVKKDDLAAGADVLLHAILILSE